LLRVHEYIVSLKGRSVEEQNEQTQPARKKEIWAMNVEPKFLQPISPSNLRNEVEKGLCTAILNGVFQPGERLVESVIAERLGVSRPPVREALSALEREGLVVNIPRRGNFVVSFTAKDIDEIYSLRVILELEAIRRAIPRFKQTNIDQLQHIVDELGNAILRLDGFDSMSILDLSFHEYIVNMADHSRLYRAWNSISMQSRLLMGVTSRTYYQTPLVPRELHQEILNAIKSGEVETAEKKVRDHFVDAQQRAIDGKHHLPLANPPEISKTEHPGGLVLDNK
jgi:DNA-binding GntR family transcriptional regulator